MKLKYYLRGLGMGILFATIVMTVSSVVHNNNLSEEKIIKEAKKLGMIMPETEDDATGGLFATKEDTEDVIDTEGQDTEIETPDTEAEMQETETEIQETETEIQAVDTEPESTEKKEPVVIHDGNVTFIEISVYPGDNARQVAERLYENGLVDDSESFRKYLGEMGYAKFLAIGEYYVPVGATYEEICNVLMRK